MFRPSIVGNAQNIEENDLSGHFVQSPSQDAAVFFRCQAQESYSLTSISSNVQSQWGYPQQHCLSNPRLWLDNIHSEDVEAVLKQLRALTPGEPQRSEYRFQYSDGCYRVLQTHWLLNTGTEAANAEIIGCALEVANHQRFQAENRLLKGIVESSSHVLTQTHYRTGMTKALASVGTALGVDRVYLCLYHSSSEAESEITMPFAWAREGRSFEHMPWRQTSFQQISGYLDLSVDCHFTGLTRNIPVPERDFFQQAQIKSTLWLPLHTDYQFHGFIGLDHCHREYQWPLSTINLLRIWAANMGGALKHHQSEEQLVYDAFHDSLTGLPNRALFLNRLRQAFQRSKRHPQAIFAILFLDLDGFKSINDTLGHSVGDQLLVAIAQRLARCLRPGDTVSRLGGDEFVVLLNDLHGIGDATSTAQRLRYQISRVFHLGEHEVFTDVSMGITLSSYGYSTVEQILGDADQAMYEAKTAGKGRYRLFKRES